jgi:hypothetical protein
VNSPKANLDRLVCRFVLANSGRNMTLQETIMPENPVDKRPKPPFPPQAQWTPGATSKLDPQPDHGERSYNGHGRLHGKTALITVADSGIGRAVAIAFAREGADVGISYLSEDEDAAATSHWVRDAGQRARVSRRNWRRPTCCWPLTRRVT